MDLIAAFVAYFWLVDHGHQAGAIIMAVMLAAFTAIQIMSSDD